MHKGDITVGIACPNCYEGDHMIFLDFNTEQSLATNYSVGICESCRNKFLIAAYVDIKNITNSGKAWKECKECGIAFVKKTQPSDAKFNRGNFCSTKCAGKAGRNKQLKPD